MSSCPVGPTPHHKGPHVPHVWFCWRAGFWWVSCWLQGQRSRDPGLLALVSKLTAVNTGQSWESTEVGVLGDAGGRGGGCRSPGCSWSWRHGASPALSLEPHLVAPGWLGCEDDPAVFILKPSEGLSLHSCPAQRRPRAQKLYRQTCRFHFSFVYLRIPGT